MAWTGAHRAKSPYERQHRVNLIPDPKPKGRKHEVAGTDDAVPIFPKPKLKHGRNGVNSSKLERGKMII
eukprot:611450-Amphidinium_carterae.1